MKIQTSNCMKKLEFTKILVEIIAILSAGLWVLFTFVIKDSPKLYQKTMFNAEMTIDSIDKDNIHVEFIAQLKNSGKQTFECDSVDIKYWLLPLDSIKHFSYFSIDNYLKKNTPIDSFTDFSLSGTYPIEQEYYETYNFFLKKDNSKMVVIQAHAYLKFNTLFGKEYFDETFFNFKLRCIPDDK